MDVIFLVMPSKNIKAYLEEHFPRGKAYLLPEEVRTFTRALRINTQDLMTELLTVAAKKAHPTISNYRVGVAGLTKNGSILLGCNLEIHGLHLNNSLHAEQFLVISSLIKKEELSAIAVTAPPCGHCRQFLNEIKGVSKLKILVTGEPERTLTELLPAPFGPSNLKISISLYEDRYNSLELKTQSSDTLINEALKHANISYAPYSSCPSGVAILLNGEIIMVGGYYIENAAFNPSVSPMLSALVHLISEGYDYKDIKEVALVERKNGPVVQEHNVKDILNSIAPKAILRTQEAIWSLVSP